MNKRKIYSFITSITNGVPYVQSLGCDFSLSRSLTLKNIVWWLLPSSNWLISCCSLYNRQLIGLVGTVFANGPGDLGSIPCRVIPKTLKMALDTSLLNTLQYKVHIKGKVKQSRERSSALPYTSVLKLLKRELSGRPRLMSPTLLYLQPSYRGSSH